MTDLETAIRDALQSRADAVVVRHTTLRARRGRRWLPPTIAAALVIALVAITVVVVRHRDPKTLASTSPVGIVGYAWHIDAVDDSAGHLRIAPSAHAFVSFSTHHAIYDDVGMRYGRYRLTDDGFVVRGGTSVVGGAGPNIASWVKRLEDALDLLFFGHGPSGTQAGPVHVLARLHGRRLTLDFAGVTLTLSRGSNAPNIPSPRPAPAPAAMLGHRWNVVTVVGGRNRISVPAGLHPYVEFTATHYTASDGVHAISGTYQYLSGGRIHIVSAAATANGYVGRDPVVLTVMTAMQALLHDGQEADIRITARRLPTLEFSTGRYLIDSQRP